MSEFVPVIDIAGWFSGDEVARQRVAHAVDDACRRSGFFQIVGHGVDDALRQAVKDVADEFFALPEDEKRRYEPPSREINRGYSGRNSESLSYSTGVARPPDLAEAFIVGNDRIVDGDPYFEAERHRSFSDASWGHIDLLGVWIEVNIGDRRPLSSFGFHVRATDVAAADEILKAILEHLGVRAFDPSAEGGIFP